MINIGKLDPFALFLPLRQSLLSLWLVLNALARGDFELPNPLISAFQCCDYKCEPPHPAYAVLGLELRASSRNTLNEH